MFYNLKIAIRNLNRNGLYSVINIVGLTMSLATCILITLWIYDEWSYDRFHAKKENLYLANTSISNEGFFNQTPGALAFYGKEEIPAIKDLHNNPNITGIATANLENMITHDFTYGVTWQGNDKTTKFSEGWFDFDFFDVMNIRLVDGALPPETATDRYCLLNETAVREMELKDSPLNLILNFNNHEYTVSGVVRDFHFESFSQPLLPMVLFCSKELHSHFYIRTTAQGTKSTLSAIETLWNEYCPNLIFSYSFLDQNFERLYQTDIYMGMLLYIFAFIAIMISCLGLFGLETFTAETKT